jgi:hypothetical protein
VEEERSVRLPGIGPLVKLAQRKKQAFVVRGAVVRMDGAALDEYLAGLGEDGPAARRLIAAVDEVAPSLLSLSSLTSPLALDYLDRLKRPIPTLTPSAGVQIVTRSYLAHVVTERDPRPFGAFDIPVLGTLPPLKRGSPPQDLMTRVVKASRSGFEMIRAVPGPVWNGFVRGLLRLAHDQVAGADENELLSVEVVDGLARVSWVFRQVDIHYGLEPEYRT